MRDKMIFWRFPKSVSVFYNYGYVLLRPVHDISSPRAAVPEDRRAVPARGCLEEEEDRRVDADALVRELLLERRAAEAAVRLRPTLLMNRRSSPNLMN